MSFKIAALQMNSGDDVAANLATADQLLAEAAHQGAGLAVLPENFAFMGAVDTAKLAHREALGEGPIQAFLARAAQHYHLEIVAGTLPLSVPGVADKVFAASLFYNRRGEVTACYQKIHLFDVDVAHGTTVESYRESNAIEPGALQPTTALSELGTVGLSVCYDLRFPELFRQLVARGSEILTVPSAFTFKTGEAHWEALLRARAIENQCYVVAPNQTGTHPGGRRTYGHSVIVDPWGVILAERDDGVGVIVADVRRQRLEEIRRNMPSLRHRRLI